MPASVIFMLMVLRVVLGLPPAMGMQSKVLVVCPIQRRLRFSTTKFEQSVARGIQSSADKSTRKFAYGRQNEVLRITWL